MTRLSTVHSLVHFNNLTSPVLSQQTNTGNVQSCYPGLLCEKFWRRILISVRQQLKSCMTVSGGGECCDSQSDSVGEFTCPGTSGAAAPSQPSHNVLCNIIVSGPPPSPPPSLSYHDSLTSGSGRPAGIWSNKQNNEAELQSPGRSWTAKSQEVEVEVEGTLLAAAAPALWAGGEKIPNKGKLQLPPPSSRLCWAGPY